MTQDFKMYRRCAIRLDFTDGSSLCLVCVYVTKKDREDASADNDRLHGFKSKLQV